MKKFVAISFVFLAFLMQWNLFAQKENNNWYFGQNAGVTFNAYFNGLPVAINSPVMVTQEGCTSVSDSLGNLLFYTNGDSVFTKGNSIMVNGTGLYGAWSSAQSAIIIPVIDNPNQYYIFTADCGNYWSRESRGINYSIVNMSLQNGLGEVIVKNKPLYKPAMEAMHAVRNQDGDGYWVVTHEMLTNNFRAFLINSYGVDIIPVISSVGPRIDFEIGELKVSPDGKKIGLTGFNSSDRIPYVLLFDFDNKTGSISNPDTIIKGEQGSGIVYSLEFSPDCSILYSTPGLSLVQTDLFEHKNIIIDSCNITDGLQMGPDKKIYVSNYSSKYLSAINEPDSLGIKCKYDTNAVRLKFGYCRCGLPNFVNNIKVETKKDKPPLNIEVKYNSPLCDGEELSFYVTTVPTAIYNWSGPNSFKSSQQNPIIDKIKSNMSGLYKLEIYLNGYKYTYYYHVAVYPKPNVMIQTNKKPIICYGDKIRLMSYFDMDADYHWSTGETEPDIIVNKSGTYSLYGINQYGCQDSSSIIISVISNITAAITGKTEFCYGDSVKLSAFPLDSSYKYLWSTGDTIPEISVSEPGEYKVVVSINENCRDTATIAIKQNNLPKVLIGYVGSKKFCEGDSLVISGYSSTTCKYYWSTGDTTQSITVKKAGNYKVTAINSNGCSNSDSIFIEVLSSPMTKISGNTEICLGEKTILTAEPSGTGCSFLWNTGETTQSITTDKAGVYKVSVTMFDFCSNEDSIIVKVNSPPKVKILGKSTICPDESTLLRPDNDYQSYLWNTGDTTKSVTINKPDKYSVSVTDSNGCTGTSSFEVKQYDIKITGLKDFEFGVIQAGTQTGTSVVLKNESNTLVVIENIFDKNLPNTFNITTIPILPDTLDIGSTIVINVTFNPDSVKFYDDSLIVEVDKPCTHYYQSYLKGSGSADLFVSIPDTTTSIGTDNFCMPLYLQKSTNLKINKYLSFKAEIRYNYSALEPANNSGKIESKDRVFNFQSDSLKLDNELIILDSICGLVLLPETDKTQFRISNFEINDTLINVKRQDGSLTVNKFCQSPIRRIQFFTPLTIILSPNPVESDLSITIPKEYQTSQIKIYSVEGIEMFKMSDTFEVSDIYKIDVSCFAPGVYYVKVGIRVCRFVKI